MSQANREEKEKIIAILLAVFLTFWAWLYTYEKNAWKFWVGLLVAVALAILFSYPELPFELPFVLLPVFNGVVWIWAIVDAALRRDEWYRYY